MDPRRSEDIQSERSSAEQAQLVSRRGSVKEN